MEKKITTLTCLSAALVAGNAYAEGCAPSCGGGDHHSPMSRPDHPFSGPMERHVFQPRPMERPEFTPIHRSEHHEFTPIHHPERPEFRPIHRSERPEFRPIHRMEDHGFRPDRGMNMGGFSHRMERHESRPAHASIENRGFRSAGHRNDFHFAGRGESRGEHHNGFRFKDHGEFRGEHHRDFRPHERNESRHFGQKHERRDGRHEAQHHQRWERHPHNGGNCHNPRSCGGQHGGRDHDHTSHHYQFIPVQPSPHWGMGGSYNEWHVIDVGVPHGPVQKVVKPAPKAKPGKQKFVRSAPARPHYQKMAQAAPCNLRYQYPTISHKKGGFYTVPASTCQTTTTVCVTVACNNAPHIG